MSSLSSGNLCGDGCPKCLEFSTPSGKKVYKCMANDTGATIIVAVCITVATLVCSILIIVLIVKLRRKNKFENKKEDSDRKNANTSNIVRGGHHINNMCNKINNKFNDMNKSNNANILVSDMNENAESPFDYDYINTPLDGNALDNSNYKLNQKCKDTFEEKNVYIIPRVNALPPVSKNKKSENIFENNDANTNFSSFHIGSNSKNNNSTSHQLSNHVRRSSKRHTSKGRKGIDDVNFKKIEEVDQEEEKIKNLIKMKSKKKGEIRRSSIKMNKEGIMHLDLDSINKGFRDEDRNHSKEKIKKMQTTKSRKTKRKKMDLID